MDGSQSMLEIARQLAKRLTAADLDATLTQVTAAAVELLPNVQYSSITVWTVDGLKTVAPTDERLLRLDAEQYQLQEGPCFQAAVETSQIVSANLKADQRFPRYGALAASEGIRSQIGVRLFDTPRSNAALNLYSTRVGAFEDLGSLSALFAHQAGQAIAYAQEMSTLSEAVKSRQTIGTAVGIVMERFGLTEERAFAFLKRLSSHQNVKLRLIAQEIVDTGGHDARA